MAKSSDAVQKKAVTVVEADLQDKGLPVGYAEQGPHSSLAVELTRAEIDQQITTAKAYPRDVRRALTSITTLATLDEQSAKECIYALPRGGTPIRGPSIRLAEIIHSQWGNCNSGARVIAVNRIEKWVDAEGVFHDLETNSRTTQRTRRPLSDKMGRLYNEDMIVMTSNAACALAKRNAILAGVPKVIWRNAYMAVERVLAGDVKTLAQRRNDAIKAFATFGVTPDQLCTMLQVKGVDDISNDHVVTLIGVHSSIRSGEARVEDIFAKADTAPRPQQKDFKASAGTVASTADGEAGGVENQPSPANATEKDDKGTPPADEGEAETVEFGHADAFEMGHQARRDNRAYDAMPEEWRDGKNEVFADAFHAGWDAEDEELKKKNRK